MKEEEEKDLNLSAVHLGAYSGRGYTGHQGLGYGSHTGSVYGGLGEYGLGYGTGLAGLRYGGYGLGRLSGLGYGLGYGSQSYNIGSSDSLSKSVDASGHQGSYGHHGLFNGIN